MYSKKKKNEYLYIIIPLVLALFIGLAFKITNDDRSLNTIEKTFKDCMLTINKVLNKPINYFKKINEDKKNTKDLLKKYNKLKEKEEQINLNEAKIIELEKEISDLKTTLDLNSTLSENSSINATVINRNVGYWYETLTVDKGKKDGIKKMSQPCETWNKNLFQLFQLLCKNYYIFGWNNLGWNNCESSHFTIVFISIFLAYYSPNLLFIFF